jgi:hypothetical protein
MRRSQVAPVRPLNSVHITRTKGTPMEIVTQTSTSATGGGSPLHWRFRTLPHDVQRVTIRRLALSGLREQEIAERTGLPEESVRRAICEDECLRTLLSDARPGSRPRRESFGLTGRAVRNGVAAPSAS